MEIEGRTYDVKEYFLEDIIQLLNFQLTNSVLTGRKQNKNRQLQDDDDDLGYEDSQLDDIEVFEVFIHISPFKKIILIVDYLNLFILKCSKET